MKVRRFAPRALRTTVALGLLIVGLVPALSGIASGEEKLSDIQARMDAIQDELNAVGAQLDALQSQREETLEKVSHLEQRHKILDKQKASMMDDVVEAATILYKNGNTTTLEALFGAESFGELTNGIELLSKVSEHDNASFVRFARLQQELSAISEDLLAEEKQLTATEAQVQQLTNELTSKFDAVAGEYAELKRKLAAAQVPVPPDTDNPGIAPPPSFQGDLACPISGPVSFIDSWLAPRDGHLHQGVDIMADYGQPVVAIMDGTITYAGYGDTAGNYVALTTTGGTFFYYMHLQEILQSSGNVAIGEQFATVGDTGNASGTPHVHFEYHPGGGDAVNPYPIASEACF